MNSPATEEVVIELPARLDYLAVARLVVTAAAGLEPALPESRLDDLKLAISEACSNAIKAQIGSKRPEPVEVRCTLAADRFDVDVRDRGPGFDPDAVDQLPEPADPARLGHESGLGLPLMRVLTDEVSFAPTTDGMVVHMSFLRTPTSG